MATEGWILYFEDVREPVNENTLGEFFRVAILEHSRAQPRFERLEPAFALPGSHGAS